MKQKSLLDPQVKPEVFRVIHIKLCQKKRGWLDKKATKIRSQNSHSDRYRFSNMDIYSDGFQLFLCCSEFLFSKDWTQSQIFWQRFCQEKLTLLTRVLCNNVLSSSLSLRVHAIFLHHLYGKMFLRNVIKRLFSYDKFIYFLKSTQAKE